jgi:hypothetical protein
LPNGGTTLVDQRLHLLQDYWQSKRRGGLLPARSDLLPEEIHHLLPNIIIYDVSRPDKAGDNGNNAARQYRYRVRLIGTRVVNLGGRDTTGLDLEETVVPSNYDNVYQRLTHVVDGREPNMGESRIYRPSRDFVRFCFIDLPLASDGTIVDMILGGRFVID